MWKESCTYLYFPRLVSDSVYKLAIEKGLESDDFFGFASAEEGDKYLGFAMGLSTLVTIDSQSVLIEREAALAYKDSLKPTDTDGGTEEQSDSSDTGNSGDDGASNKGTTGNSTGVPVAPRRAVKTQFYGSTNLDPTRAKMCFSDIVDEIIQQFNNKSDINVSISIEIQANSKKGFNEDLQRTVKEN